MIGLLVAAHLVIGDGCDKAADGLVWAAGWLRFIATLTRVCP